MTKSILYPVCIAHTTTEIPLLSVLLIYMSQTSKKLETASELEPTTKYPVLKRCQSSNFWTSSSNFSECIVRVVDDITNTRVSEQNAERPYIVSFCMSTIRLIPMMQKQCMTSDTGALLVYDQFVNGNRLHSIRAL